MAPGDRACKMVKNRSKINKKTIIYQILIDILSNIHIIYIILYIIYYFIYSFIYFNIFYMIFIIFYIIFAVKLRELIMTPLTPIGLWPVISYETTPFKPPHFTVR